MALLTTEKPLADTAPVAAPVAAPAPAKAEAPKAAPIAAPAAKPASQADVKAKLDAIAAKLAELEKIGDEMAAKLPRLWRAEWEVARGRKA